MLKIRIVRRDINPAKIKPIYIMNQPGLSAIDKTAVLEGARELIRLADVNGIEIADFGAWQNNVYRTPDGSLREFQSAEWYINRGRANSRNSGQLNADALQIALLTEPWRDPRKGGKDHYDIFIVHSDMYSQNTNFVIGLAQEGIGTTISTHRFQGLEDRTRFECIKTETIHELGHVFGLVPNERTTYIEYSLGKHCTNRCIMRQGLRLPTDWINFTNDRQRYGALCPTCSKDLREYFRK